jgi:predicted nucleotidyltransferase
MYFYSTGHSLGKMTMMIKSVITSQHEKTPSWYTPITEEMLQEMTRRIVEEFQPEKIILFGSYAYGQPAFHSDVDLLVVTNRFRRKSVFERDWLVARVARPPGIAMDVIVRTPTEVAYRLKIGDRFFREVMTKGLVLYERSQPRRRMGYARRVRKAEGDFHELQLFDLFH